jgi:hypothetical protein
LTRFAPDGAVMRGLAAGHERWTDMATLVAKSFSSGFAH